MKNVLALFLLAAVFWFLIFSPWTYHWLNFWVKILIASGVLAFSGLWVSRKNLWWLHTFRPRYILVGIGSALLLYLIFWMGNSVSTAIFASAQPQIASIYGNKTQASPLLIALSLLLVIGPAEEIFWRGFVQGSLSSRLGDRKGYLYTAVAYAAIHIWAFNSILLAAALICGLFWGAMFMHYKSVWPSLMSHSVWDLAVFVLFPFQ